MIVTGLFYQVKELTKLGYVCIDVNGTHKGDDLVKIPDVKTSYHMWKYNKEYGDFKACRILFYRILKEAGGVKKVLDWIYEQGPKIALIGYYRQDKFDYKYILAQEILTYTGEIVEDFHGKGNFPLNLDYQYQLSRFNPYEQNGHDNLDHEYVGNVLESHKWKFARTMPESPHYYTLRKTWDNDPLYLQIVKHIRCTGAVEVYQGCVYYMFFWKNQKYWTHPVDITNEECDLINKTFIK